MNGEHGGFDLLVVDNGDHPGSACLSMNIRQVWFDLGKIVERFG